jgi:beta-glucanase (GH16 family)
MMRLFLALLLFSQTLRAADPWKLVWSDEFNGSGLPDPAHWTNEVGFIRNREAQFYTAGREENARLEDGKLIIEARKEHFKNNAGTRRGPEFAEYTSASLNTRGLASWTYGRIEVRARLPQGRGVWPAIWMLGTNMPSVGWPKCGEIDIMEFVGLDPNHVHANIHTGKYNHVRGTGKGSKIDVQKENVSGTFHVYALEWTPERLDLYFDKTKYFTYAKEDGAGKDAWPFDQPCYLILNLAIGGAWGGQKGIDDAIFPQRYAIDYVRVYQQSKH